LFTVIVHLLDVEWLLSTLFDASLLNFEPPATAALFCAQCRGDAHAGGNYNGSFRMRALARPPPARDAGRQSAVAARKTGRVGVKRTMSDKSASEVEAVSFGERLANSPKFAQLFRDGMSLVEETATYLDGPGRQESKALDRAAALAYATESMRLTTRLMQLASWLLLHRAVKEGEMSLAQASKEKSKVKLSAAEAGSEQTVKLLPERLRALIARSRALQADVLRLDSTIHAVVDPARQAAGNPVEHQLGLLKAAFEREAK
jgi:regulator of CtrA degradation